MTADRLVMAVAVALSACNGEVRFDEDGPTPLEAASLDTGREGATDSGCSIDGDCPEPGYPKCDGALSRCVQCVVDTDCGTGRRCEPVTRRCVTVCSDAMDSACASAGRECSDRLRICVACGDDTGCSSRDLSVCDPAVGVCVQCVTDAQCPLDRPHCDRTRGACT